MTASILTALLFLAPVVTENARFTIRQDGRVVGTEEFTIRKTNRGYSADGKTRLEGDSNPLISRMELDSNLVPISYEYTHGSGTIRIQVTEPSSELNVIENGESSSTNFRFPAGASIVDNNFFHHYLLLLYRVKSVDQTVPIFVPQDMQVGQARVHSTGNRTFALEVGDIKLEATVDGDGRLIRLSVPEAKVVVER